MIFTFLSKKSSMSYHSICHKEHYLKISTVYILLRETRHIIYNNKKKILKNDHFCHNKSIIMKFKMADVKEGKVPVTEKNVNFLFYFHSCLLSTWVVITCINDHSKSLQQ